MKDLKISSLSRNCLLGLGLLAVGGTSYAEESLPLTLNFMFSITAAPCEVNTQTVPVNLGNMFTTDFSVPANAQYGGEWTPFVIKVENCPDQTERVKITFSGTPSGGDATKFYANTGSAGNVDVEIQSNDSTNTNLGNGQVWTQDIDMASKGTTINLKARAHAMVSGVAVSPGDISSAVLATFTYE